MAPTIDTGDIVFIKETQEINKDDIISFKVNGSVVTHRVVDIIQDENNEVQYRTKGDANPTEDIETANMNNIEGKYFFKIPKVGTVILFLKTKEGLFILICIFALGMFFTRDKGEKEEKREKKSSKH